jgi:hypothetical protein
MSKALNRSYSAADEVVVWFGQPRMVGTWCAMKDKAGVIYVSDDGALIHSTFQAQIEAVLPRCELWDVGFYYSRHRRYISKYSVKQDTLSIMRSRLLWTLQSKVKSRNA